MFQPNLLPQDIPYKLKAITEALWDKTAEIENILIDLEEEVAKR